jgi:5-formyltetrahydrofolate cyclo-ligase
MTKAEWRKVLRDKALANQAKDINSLVKTVSDFLSSHQQETWGAYKAHQFEPDLQGVYQDGGLNWAFPLVRGEKMSWLIPGPQGFFSGAYGIREPVALDARQVDVNGLSGVLIPAVGFDRRGYRLGRGKGYYDRALFGAAKLLKVGVIWDCQLVEELPHEPHDLKVDVILTESMILQLRG